MKSIVLAGGCFWGVHNYFNQVKGVVKTRCGYTAGFTEFPTYKQVCSGLTGHTEAVIVHYNSELTTLKTLLEHFFNIVDPTLVDQQGPDVGSQYRSGIYYYTDEDRDVVEEFIDSIRGNYDTEIVTEVEECQDFWEAEEYHQNYLEKNPGGYCHIDPGKFYCSIKIDYGDKQAFAMCNPGHGVNEVKPSWLPDDFSDQINENHGHPNNSTKPSWLPDDLNDEVEGNNVQMVNSTKPSWHPEGVNEIPSKSNDSVKHFNNFEYNGYYNKSEIIEEISRKNQNEDEEKKDEQTNDKKAKDEDDNIAEAFKKEEKENFQQENKEVEVDLDEVKGYN